MRPPPATGWIALPVFFGKAYARERYHREVVASRGRAGDIERSSGVERVCRANQLGGFARGESLLQREGAPEGERGGASLMIEEGVFTVDWNQPAPDGSGRPLIPNEVVHALIQHFDAHDLSNHSVPPDVLGRAYEYLLRKFAEGSGQSAGDPGWPARMRVRGSSLAGNDVSRV